MPEIIDVVANPADTIPGSDATPMSSVSLPATTQINTTPSAPSWVVDNWHWITIGGLSLALGFVMWRQR